MTKYFANTSQVRAKKRRNTDVFRVFTQSIATQLVVSHEEIARISGNRQLF